MWQAIVEHINHYLVVHFVAAAMSLSIKLVNDRVLHVKDFAWAMLFGPFHFLVTISDLDAVVIDIRKNDKK